MNYNFEFLLNKKIKNYINIFFCYFIKMTNFLRCNYIYLLFIFSIFSVISWVTNQSQIKAINHYLTKLQFLI